MVCSFFGNARRHVSGNITGPYVIEDGVLLRDRMLTTLIVFFMIALVISFLCSLWEAVLLSITPAFAQIKQQEGSLLGQRLQEFKQDIDRPLVAILTLNTIAHTVGAIGVGDQAARIWAESNPLITSLVVPALMTLGILVLSEIIPKTLGANYWQELASFTVTSLTAIITLLLPLVWFSQLITGVLKKKGEKSIFSRSDFVAMAEIGAESGVFREGESEVIRNLLRFDTIEAKDIMTPRTVVVMANQEQSLESFHETHPTLQFSRIPLSEGDRQDHVTGYFLRDELLAAIVAGNGGNPLSSIRRDILITQRKKHLPELFNWFIERREHIALVVDEFGGMAGIVTMEDIIETLLGMEIVDEMDKTANMQEVARRTWERRARRMGLLSDPEPAALPPAQPGPKDDLPGTNH